MFGRKNEEILKLNSKIEEIESELNKLTRIIKNSKTGEVAFHLKEVNFSIHFGNILRGYVLLIYSDNEEYIIELNELENLVCYDENCSIELKDNLIYFTCLARDKHWSKIKIVFIIDYKRGNYLIKENEVMDF